MEKLAIAAGVMGMMAMEVTSLGWPVWLAVAWGLVVTWLMFYLWDKE